MVSGPHTYVAFIEESWRKHLIKMLNTITKVKEWSLYSLHKLLFLFKDSKYLKI